jgi:hypothetical protein
MRGRQAPGPEFVQRLQGEASAKQRLEVILQTVAGRLGVKEAAATLGITPQRLHTLRAEALRAGVDQLTPRPGGRPRQTATPEQQRIAALEAEVERLGRELAASQLSTEIAVLLPGRPKRLEKKRATQAEPTPSAARRRTSAGPSGGAARSRPRGRRGNGSRRAAGGQRDHNANREDPSAPGDR